MNKFKTLFYKFRRTKQVDEEIIDLTFKKEKDQMVRRALKFIEVIEKYMP